MRDSRDDALVDVVYGCWCGLIGIAVMIFIPLLAFLIFIW